MSTERVRVVKTAPNTARLLSRRETIQAGIAVVSFFARRSSVYRAMGMLAGVSVDAKALQERSVIPSGESLPLGEKVDVFTSPVLDTQLVRAESSSSSALSEPVLKPLTSKESKEQKALRYKNELEVVLKQMNEHHFSAKYKRDVKMYYRIYKEVAEKYNMDWYLLWIIHEAETGASAGKRGFAPGSYYIGGFQIAPFWQKYANQAFRGLGDLSIIKTRHKSDAKQAALAGWILHRNITHSMKHHGASENSAVHNALRLYSARRPAEKRYKQYVKYKKIFK
jgi:hypothetical protein